MPGLRWLLGSLGPSGGYWAPWVHRVQTVIGALQLVDQPQPMPHCQPSDWYRARPTPRVGTGLLGFVGWVQGSLAHLASLLLGSPLHRMPTTGSGTTTQPKSNQVPPVGRVLGSSDWVARPTPPVLGSAFSTDQVLRISQRCEKILVWMESC